MNFYVSIALNHLITVPAIVSWVRYKNINPAFYPFLIWVWAGFLNETISIFLMFNGYYNIVNFNIFLLAQSLLFLWLFKRWNLFNQKKIYFFLLTAFIVAWLRETIFFSKLTQAFNSYFLIFHSFIIVLMSISIINMLLMKERASLSRNPVFIICSALVLFFTLQVLTEAFWAYGVKLSPSFQNGLTLIVVFTNLFCNFIYTLAIVWMPKKQPFTLQY